MADVDGLGASFFLGALGFPVGDKGTANTNANHLRFVIHRQFVNFSSKKEIFWIPHQRFCRPQ